MNRNTNAIFSEDQILNAARTVYQITKLLKLHRDNFLDMMQSDVLGRIAIAGASNRGLLEAFAHGVQQTYLTILLTEHCEFVYYLASGAKVGVKEAISLGPAALQGANNGYRWKDSDFEFTDFAEEVDLWT